jgi:hypothetical protein
MQMEQYSTKAIARSHTWYIMETRTMFAIAAYPLILFSMGLAASNQVGQANGDWIDSLGIEPANL